MSVPLSVSLTTNAEQATRLRELQLAFTQVCNALSPVVRDTRCWNRVALHHMTYRSLREKFPQMGSQMICNAIYSVSRTCRLVYQSPTSPFNLSRLGAKPLPLIQFAPASPVYFDRHTLSLKDGHLSMFTLDGRMRFDLNVASADERRFHEEKLLEIVLLSEGESFRLVFLFADGPTAPGAAEEESPTHGRDDLPEYVLVLPEIEAPAAAGLAPPASIPNQLTFSGDPA